MIVRDRYEEVWLRALRDAQAELVAIEPFILRRLVYGMTLIKRPRGRRG